MLRVEITEAKTKQQAFVEFFDDDTIDTVRQQIGRMLDIHPDRLLILARMERSKDYYKKNPTRWEALFNRLSLTEPIIQKRAFTEYQTFYRNPTTSIIYDAIDRSDWMEIPDIVKNIYEPDESFSEYMLFGVKEKLSYILPLEYNSELMKNINPASYPLPEMSTLVSTLYDIENLKGFYCVPYDSDAENVQPIYFPMLRSNTPDKLSDEEIGLLAKNEKKIKGIFALKSPKPANVSIIRTRFHIPFIDTDFGSAVRARFEQIFYGLTVSKDVPCVTMYTSSDEVSRHKFFAENPKNKSPFIDLAAWNSWWNTTKPSRSRPTLILYRGKSNQFFDRISITSIDMVVSTYRPDGNTETIEELKDGIFEWIKSFDSILPFVKETDLDEERWELQDMSFIATYEDTMKEYDLRRFPCISSIFDVADIENSMFRFLRTDYSVRGISAVEMKILQLMRENPSLIPSDIAEELSISVSTARSLLAQIHVRLEKDPDILEKAFRGFPSMRFGPKTVLLSSTNRLEKSLQYANALRYILTSPDAEDIDEVCPKRLEVVESKAIAVNTEINPALLDEYADLIGDIDIEDTKTTITEAQEEPSDVFLVKSDRKTLYNYFNARLQKFDPKTYETAHSEYPKKCEQKHQPIILNDDDIKKLTGTPYDPRTYLDDKQLLKVEDPNGLVICPEYWCIQDEIPLQENQLINTDGFQKCPKCNGKVKEKLNQNPQEYTVIKRDKAFQYPKLTKYKSPTNGRIMPCCYKTSKGDIKKEIPEDKYYILGETKIAVPALRLSFIGTDILNSLHINEKYESFGTQARIQSAMSGFFRVGLGRPSETLPSLLGLDTKLKSPLENPNVTKKCSFFTTWMNLGEGSDELERRVSGINSAYEQKELTVLQELEFVALSLQCDVFRISNANMMECFFQTRMNRSKSRGILVMQEDTVVSFVRRENTMLTYTSNIYNTPFTKKTYQELEKLRDLSCKTTIPTYDNALSVIQALGLGSHSIILDPYLRAQAIYIPKQFILPFQSTSIPETESSKIKGFENATDLPSHAEVLKYLETAKKFSEGYAWAEDMHNSKNEIVEVRLKSGLRIPIVPEASVGEPSEVIMSMGNENDMVFGENDKTLEKTYSEISYASEIFDFLLFELSKTLHEYSKLRELMETNPTRKTIEAELKLWFENTTKFVNLSSPSEFISKIRTPCGQFKTDKSCSGNVCGWDGKVCRVEIRKSVSKEAIFHRLLSTLVENAKIRAIVLDERVTPFFSTILYMELPNELILTDLEIKA